MEDFKHIPKLIQKYLCDTLDVSEEKLLNDWKGKSAENNDIFQHVVSDLSLGKYLMRHKKYNVDDGWLELNRKLRKGLSKRIIIGFARFAAIVLVPILATWYLFSVNTEFDTVITADTPEIREDQVSLVLSDGRVMSLDKQNQIIKEVSYVGISNDSLVGLQYQQVKRKIKDKKVLYNTLKTPCGGDYQLTLSDGTQVWLNSVSELRYPVQFTGKERRVSLNGEAYFNVVENENSPFIVDLGEQQVKVLGTEFNVSAYKDEDVVMTTLINGKVQFKSQCTEDELEPNMQCLYAKPNGKSEIRAVNVDDYTNWRQGLFVFKAMSFGKIMRQIERWYDVRVFYQKESCKSSLFWGQINKEMSLEDVLNIFSETGKVRFDYKNDRILVY